MFDQTGLLAPAQALCCDNGFQLFFRGIEIIVDQDVIVTRPMAYLIPALLHALGNGFCGVLSPALKSALKFCDRGWQDEN